MASWWNFRIGKKGGGGGLIAVTWEGRGGG